MKRLIPKTISRFLIFAIAGFLIAAFGILGSFTYSSFLKTEQDRFTEELALLTNLAGKAFIQPVWTLDTGLVESMSKAFLDNNSSVKGIVVNYADGSKMTSRGVIDDPSLKQKSTLILFDDNKIGQVTLYFSAQKVDSFADQLRYSILFIFTLVTINLVVLVTIILNFILGAPMRELQQIALDISLGKYDFPKPSWKFEFKDIGEAFWQASRRIQERDKKLEENRFNLEKIVEMRTRELDEQRLQLISKNRLAALGEFSAGIAHEINNPLAVISGKSMIIKRRLEKHPEYSGLSDDLDKIGAMVTRISKIINGLRNFARDGANEIMQEVNVLKFLDEIRDLSLVRMQNRGIKLHVHVEPADLKMTVREVQLSQVIINLINNSTDAIADQDEKWIEISSWSEQETIYIRVMDSGSGIPKEIQERIFQPFFTTKETGKGTGIGLSISVGIIKEHGGELAYESYQPNTSFLIKLYPSRRVHS